MILLADHLHGEAPIFIYRVANFEGALATLRARVGRRTVRPSKFRTALAAPSGIPRECGSAFTRINGRKYPKASRAELTGKSTQRTVLARGD
jgi:hypothetical protein